VTTGRDRLAGRRILVTGAAGFIGSHTVRALASAGAEVVAVDQRPVGDGGGIQARCLDLRAPGAAAVALPAGIDTVVHLAASTSVLQSVDRPQETFDNNVAVTSSLLEQARRVGVRSFVFASTNAVVGPTEDPRIHEGSQLHPLTPYGATKAAAEMLMSAYSSSYGLKTCALRLTNVYGPGMAAKDSIVPRLMRAVRSGAAFDVYGDGRQIRDYVYVDDVVAAIVSAIRMGAGGRLVVGSGRSSSVLQLIDIVRQVSGADLAVRHVAAKPGEMPSVVVDISRARSLGWRPTVNLEDGLRQVWELWDSNLLTVS
jgi:UDP-glucose 4-epimerase